MANMLATVEGEMVIKENGNKSLEFYKEEFVLDGEIDTPQEARSIIRKGLISERLREKPGFAAVRTCQITDFKETDQKLGNNDLDKVLYEAIRLNCVPENINSYKRPDYKLKALNSAIEKAKKRKERLAKKSKLDEARDLGRVQ